MLKIADLEDLMLHNKQLLKNGNTLPEGFSLPFILVQVYDFVVLCLFCMTMTCLKFKKNLFRVLMIAQLKHACGSHSF